MARQKIVRLQRKKPGEYYLILPKSIVEELRWKRGDVILVERVGDGIMLRRVLELSEA